MKIIFNFIFLVLLATAFPNFSAVGAATHTIPELVDLALKNNPETRAAWWKTSRAAANLGISNSTYYPEVSLKNNVAAGRTYRYLEGPETGYQSFDATVFLSYMLFDFGERKASSEAAKAALIASRWQSNWIFQQVMHTVMTQAYSYLHAHELLQSREASLQDVQKTMAAVEELHNTGLRSAIDVYAIKATRANMQMGVSRQKGELDIARGKIASTVGYSVLEPIEIAHLPDPTLEAIQEQQLSYLLALAEGQRADLIAKRAELKHKHELENKTQAAYKPKIRLNADSGYKRYEDDKKADGFHYNVGITLDVPLFTGFQDFYQKRLAAANTQLSTEEVAELKLNIAVEVLQAARSFEAAQEVIRYGSEQLFYSVKAFEGALEKYKSGVESIFDLLAAQTQLAEARIKYGDAKIFWYRSLALLSYATGSLSPST